MKLKSYYLNGTLQIGIEQGDELVEIKGFADMTDLIRELADIPAAGRTEAIGKLAGEPVDQTRIRPAAPIVHPVKDVVCVGLNYQEHVNESQSMGLNEDKTQIHTTYFGKRCDYIRGDGEAIRIHAGVDPEMDYETELAVIIGKAGTAICREDAHTHIFGYSIGNDLSSRALQRNHKQWFLGKGLDGYTAMGPCILINESEDKQDFELRGYVNDELRQSSTTQLMIKSVADIIYEISRAITLVPGDIIFTGTPAGVGAGFKPPKYLKAGDVLRLEIDGIGALSNPVSAS